MLTTIYLVRHAHSNYSSDELGRGLSENGIRDVKCVSRLLIEEDIEVFISSPYRRAIQTIEGAASALEMNVELYDCFKERILAETPVEDFATCIQNVWADPNFSLLGGESNYQAQKRGVEGLTAVLERHRGKRIAIGTHGNIMAIIMNYYDSKYDYRFWKGLSMPDIYKFSFEDNRLIDVERIWVD